MPIPTSVLQELRQQLIKRTLRISDSALLTALHFGPVSNGRFTITATWENGSFSKTYSADAVINKGPRGYNYRKTFCSLTDDLIKDILKARGVIK
jgi:hypothetical protein